MYVGRGETFRVKSEVSGSRRSRLDIAADILYACRRGVRKTGLMYRCNMSFMQLEKYLDFLLGAGFLVAENDGSSLLFKTSGKGRTFLKEYENLKVLVEGRYRTKLYSFSR